MGGLDTSYLVTQVTTIIGQLHGLFDDIGVPAHERETRETELFTALSETLNNQLRLVTSEKNELMEEAHRIIKATRLMEIALVDQKPSEGYAMEEAAVKITLPLSKCIANLKDQHNNVAKVHRDRLEQVQKLVDALKSYSCHLEPAFLQVSLPPIQPDGSVPLTVDLSPSYATSLDQEFSRVYEEFERRVQTVQTTAEEIVNLWAELGVPQAQTDLSIVKHYKETPEQLGLHKDDISRLRARRDKLLEEKAARDRKIKEMKATIEELWDRLNVEDMDRKRFSAATRGVGLRVINDLEAELVRLNELKRQNLHLFVEDARCKLQALWDSLYFSEEEMLAFHPAFSDVYSDALLAAHESEISRLEALREQRLPILEMIEKHRSIIADREELANSSQDASRLMAKGQKGERRDPGKLLREEKMRKRIARELPKVEVELRKTLDKWEEEYGRPFLVHGRSYIEEMEESNAKAPPPRAKTPSALPPSARPSKPPISGHSRATSTAQPQSVRAGARTPASTMRTNPHPVTQAATLRTSPTKIPTRAPLSVLRTGNNSPERRPYMSATIGASVSRKPGSVLARAPPPKMRDLNAPTSHHEPLGSDTENWRSSSLQSEGSVVRQVAPEDPYTERRYEQMSYAPPPTFDVPSNANQYEERHQMYQRPVSKPPVSYRPHQPPSREFSTTSSVTNTASGSENWETYDDASEFDDTDAAHYARQKAAHNKRLMVNAIERHPDGKKVRAMYDVDQTPLAHNGRVMIAGSDAGWSEDQGY